MKLCMHFCLVVLFFVQSIVFAQSSINGLVLDEAGEPLSGAHIIDATNGKSSITDANGKFSLRIDGEALLQVTLVGYETQNIEVNEQSELKIVLKKGILLDEVVVSALGLAREKRALGYSVGKVSGKDITQAREHHIGNQLAGRIPGVNVSSSASGPASSTEILIRGVSSISYSNRPLVVIDGVPIDNSQWGAADHNGGEDWGDGLSSVNSDDVENMHILKGAAAAALYGSRVPIQFCTGANYQST